MQQEKIVRGLQHYASKPTNALLETKLMKYEQLLQKVPERSIPIDASVGDWYWLGRRNSSKFYGVYALATLYEVQAPSNPAI